MSHSKILIQGMSYQLTSNKQLFNKLHLSFTNLKYGLVGKNGVGKTTLLKLIVGDLCPQSGSIQINGKLSYVPQELNLLQNLSIARYLGYEDKIIALKHIKQGSLEQQDFTVLNEEWDVEDRLLKKLSRFGLENISYCRDLSTLSGGEMTRLMLTKVFASDADFLLLDEPTNHLDLKGREELYHAIKQWTGGLIVSSHDRTLLNLMDETIELSSLGVLRYGMNYDAYVEQKKIEKQAACDLLQARNDLLQKTKQTIQVRKERHQQNEAKGRRNIKAQIQAKGTYDKITLKSAKGRSERTNRRINIQAERKHDWNLNLMQSAKNKIEIENQINVELPDTYVANGKIILDIENLCFTHEESEILIIQHFDLKITGPERIVFAGDNGSGKTTLIKLILGELKPNVGSITLGTDRICYVDQTTSLLDLESSVLENFLHLNPDAKENDAYMCLAKFLFKNTSTQILVKDLSGGEKLRALLACVLLAKNPPQLLILDEPTNHLDITSIESIESALKHFQGAMIIISHDQTFLKNIGAQKKIKAPYRK